MAEKMEDKKGFSTCLEDPFLAEMMQKMLAQQGIGSLCAKMMKQVIEKRADGRGLPCAEMMRSMMKGCSDTEEKTKETQKEKSHG